MPKSKHRSKPKAKARSKLNLGDQKSLVLIIIGAGIFIGGIYFFKYSGTPTTAPLPSATPTVTKPVAVAPSPIFGYMSKWVPDAVWDAPIPSNEDDLYGNLTGMAMNGKIREGGELPSSNEMGKFEDIATMTSLGFKGDINLSADGPGASRWGYKKVENGKTQIVIFSYSSSRIYGPEATELQKMEPTTLSVFVSDPFVAK